MSGGLPGILEEDPMEGGDEVPVLRFFEDPGGWLHWVFAGFLKKKSKFSQNNHNLWLKDYIQEDRY